MGSMGMPRCLARPFPEPAGIMPSDTSVPQRARAVSLTVPSPPHAAHRPYRCRRQGVQGAWHRRGMPSMLSPPQTLPQIGVMLSYRRFPFVGSARDWIYDKQQSVVFRVHIVAKLAKFSKISKNHHDLGRGKALMSSTRGNGSPDETKSASARAISISSLHPARAAYVPLGLASYVASSLTAPGKDRYRRHRAPWPRGWPQALPLWHGWCGIRACATACAMLHRRFRVYIRWGIPRLCARRTNSPASEADTPARAASVSRVLLSTTRSASQ